MNIITSKNNPKIISAAKLKNIKYRNITNEFLIESIKVVEAALNSDYLINSIFYDADKKSVFKDIIYMAGKMQIDIIAVSEDVIKKISYGKSPQGIIAVAKIKEQTLDNINTLTIIACESIKDPGNLGTIIRTADATGAGALIVNKDCADIYNDKVLRASMGSVFNMKIVKSDDFVNTIINLKHLGYKAGCGHLGGTDFFSRRQNEKTLLIIGNESNGISQLVIDVCDDIWKLPMMGKVQSLNAAVAAGIMMYDIAIRGNNK